jgi:hypothetical protein
MSARRALILLVALGALAQPGQAREFRSMTPIATPQRPPPGAVVPGMLRPVERALVERAVHAVARAWNTGVLDSLLAEDFVNGSRLSDVIREVVPRDASLRVLGIEGVSTLEQYLRLDAAGAPLQISTVSAVVRTQIEFTDPVTGFQRLEGRNELIFRVEQPAEGHLGERGK